MYIIHEKRKLSFKKMTKYTRKSIAQQLAPQLSVTEQQAEHILITIIDTFKSILKEEDAQIIIRGFGRFDVIKIPERMVRDPNTGESFLKPAHQTVRFKAYPELKGE